MADGIFAKLFGVEKVKTKFKRITADLEREMGKTMAEAAETVRAEAERLIRQPKSGKWTSTKSGLLWRRSAPGQAPARGEGKLLNQIVVRKMNRKLKPGARLISLARHGKFLEHGTSKMAARPFFGPAFRAKKREIERKVKVDARHALRKQVKR